MNSRPMILRLRLRVGHPGQRGQEVGAASTTLSSTPVAATKSFSTCSASPGAQQPVVDEHAGEPRPDGPLHQRGGDRGVHAAGQPADRPAVADLRPRSARSAPRSRRAWSSRPAAGRGQEPAQHDHAVLGVQDLGMELHAVQLPVRRPRRRRPGVPAVLAVTVKPGGATAQVSPCDIHTCWWPGSPLEQHARARRPRCSAVAPYSPAPVRRPRRPGRGTMSWKP